MTFAPNTLEHAIVYALVFGLMGIALVILGFKVFDWITPRIDIQRELGEKHNIAVAIVCAGVIVGICIVISRAIG